MRVDYIYYFFLALFGLFILIQGLQWIQNTKIKNRFKKFKYFDDYGRFKDLINPKLSKKIIIFANFLLLLNIAFLVTFSFIDFAVYRYYFYMLIPIVISDATILFHEYTRKFQQLDLEEVDVAYYKIDGIITNNDRFIQEKETVIKDITTYMKETQEELSPLLGKSSSALFSSIIEDLNKKKAQLQSKIDNLQSNIEQMKVAFVETLNLKLKNEKTNFNKIFKATSMDSADKDPADEMLEIKRLTEEKIAQAIDSYVSLAQKLPLSELQVIFQTYARFSDSIKTSSVVDVLEKMEIETNEYEFFASLLYSVPMDIGDVFKKFFIPRDIQWIYTPQFAQLLNPPQKRAVYKELMHQKATLSLQKILAQLDPVTLSEMDELSHMIDVSPEVTEKINRYQRITDRLYQGFNALNAAENIYLILDRLERPQKATQEFLRSHPLEGIDVNQYAERIFELYHLEFNVFATDIISIIEIIDAFKGLSENSRTLFNWQSLEDFILENAGLLKIQYVYLGLGLFLVDLEKTNLFAKIKELAPHQQVKFEQLLNHFDQQQNMDFNRIKETGKWDKNIFSHPRLASFREKLPNIIMRIENQRMTLNEMRI